MSKEEKAKELIKKNFAIILNGRNMKTLPMVIKKGWYFVAIRFSIYELREKIKEINSFLTSEDYNQYQEYIDVLCYLKTLQNN